MIKYAIYLANVFTDYFITFHFFKEQLLGLPTTCIYLIQRTKTQTTRLTRIYNRMGIVSVLVF